MSAGMETKTMRSLIRLLLAASVFIFSASQTSTQILQRRLVTDKGETRDAIAAHPLSWWTQDPLRFDTTGMLMLGHKAPDGQPLTLKDYRLERTVTTVGEVAGHRIVQILTRIYPGSRVIAAGFASDNGSPGEWKDLLVQQGDGDSFIEVYALHLDTGGLYKETNAAMYRSGPQAVLGTYDPDTGNGGGCADGYWWFDKNGPHEVDFSALIRAVMTAIPAKATFTPNCWALHPEIAELSSAVQRMDPECHACGILGQVHATYRIEQGIAKPVSVSFESAKP